MHELAHGLVEQREVPLEVVGGQDRVHDRVEAAGLEHRFHKGAVARVAQEVLGFGRHVSRGHSAMKQRNPVSVGHEFTGHRRTQKASAPDNQDVHGNPPVRLTALRPVQAASDAHGRTNRLDGVQRHGRDLPGVLAQEFLDRLA